jgi:NAD-dependent deacetylase
MTTSSGFMDNIKFAAEIIRNSKYTVVLTGAGISTPSGIPDFRSPTSGLWERYDPFDVASLSAFRYHPENFFNWMRPLARNIHAATPNIAHVGLAQLERAGYLHTIITQNIDELHQRAGSSTVLEVHGSLRTLTCTGCFRQQEASHFIQSYIENGDIPRCEYCGEILKPDVILYGEQLPARIWLQAQASCQQCELMIVAGSSLEVLPVAGLPMRALENGAHLIIINQSKTYADIRADIVLANDVAIAIPLLVKEVLGEGA